MSDCNIRFNISGKELLDIQAWRVAHDAERHSGKHPYAGAIGGSLSYEFTPTGLGRTIVVRCICGEEFNATDFEDW